MSAGDLQRLRGATEGASSHDAAVSLHLHAHAHAHEHPHEADRARAASDELEQRYPGSMEDMAASTMAQLRGGPGSRAEQAAHARARRDLGMSAQDAKQHRERAAAGSRAPTRPSPAPASRPRRARPSYPSVPSWVVPDTGGWGQFGLKALGWGLGLSLLYLVLSKSESAGRGQAPFELLFGGITAALSALVSPLTDPLSPRGPKVAAAAARPAYKAAAAKPVKASAMAPAGHTIASRNVRSTPSLIHSTGGRLSPAVTRKRQEPHV